MTLCKFWKSGYCREGDACRFEHPSGISQRGKPPPRQSQGSISNSNQNKFGLFDRVNSAPSNTTAQAPRQQQTRTARDNREQRGGPVYGIVARTIQDDLQVERPLWMMSAYGPGKDAPIQIFGGSLLEQSSEEIRMLHYQAQATGNLQQSMQLEGELAERANTQVNMVLNDVEGALQYLRNGENEHPNRRDICANGTSHRAVDGEFSSQKRKAAFRYQQKLARNTDPVPLPFPMTQSNAPLGFGQPPAQFTGICGFAAPIVPPIQPSFVPDQPMLTPQSFQGPFANVGFLQAQPTVQTFNQPVQAPQAHAPPFGQPVEQTATNGQAAFGQAQSNIPFGSNAIIGANMSNGSNTGQQINNTSGFHPQTNQILENQQQAQANLQNTVFEARSSNGVTNGTQQVHNTQTTSLSSPSLSDYATRDGAGRLIAWKGRPVQYVDNTTPCYRRQDGSLERIWFPNGQPQPSQSNSMDGVAFPEQTLSAYRQLYDQGVFVEGQIPELAPRPDMVRWDI